MVEYIDKIMSLYVENVWEKVGAEKAALVITDNLKHLTTTKNHQLPRHSHLLASSKHDRLQLFPSTSLRKSTK